MSKVALRNSHAEWTWTFPPEIEAELRATVLQFNSGETFDSKVSRHINIIPLPGTFLITCGDLPTLEKFKQTISNMKNKTAWKG